MPIAFKIILNVFIFIVYLILSIIFWNFLYWLVLTSLWNNVPWSADPVHMKIALVILFIVLIFTVIFRRFFYFKIDCTKKKVVEKNNTNEKVVKDFVFDDIDKNKEKPKKVIKKEKSENKDEMEIFMGKEIK